MDKKIIDLIVATLCWYIFAVVPAVILFISLSFLIFSSYRWILVPYLVWIWIDRKAGERGGRFIEGIRKWSCWKRLHNYFQIQFIREEECNLDAKRNYLFCCFPHGIVPVGIMCMITNFEKTKQLLPHHVMHLCGHYVHFYIPFTRELLLACGIISASEKSIKYKLTMSEGGNAIFLAVGGAAEIVYYNTYKIILKKRRGFARIALETGTSLVPVINFNEACVFEQFRSPLICKIQEFLREIFIYPLILVKGRYLICPREVPLTVLGTLERKCFSMENTEDKIVDLVLTTFFWYLFAIAPVLISLLTLFFLIFSSYRWILIPYLVWIWMDRKVADRGGRVSEGFRKWSGWNYCHNYFQTNYIKEEECNLDPKRNYLFCCFPHGIVPVGILCMMVNCEKRKRILPYHTPFACMLNVAFYTPFTRDLFLASGCISASEKSLKYTLTLPDGGNVVCLLVGGAAEVAYCVPNVYKFVLKNRRGFVRIALETGTPLVPVITFNETSIFDQFRSPMILKIQEYLRKIFMYFPVLIKGRFLICPRRVPITVLVGKPIEVKKNPTPRKEEIDELHELFTIKLTELFEKNKHKYIENADNTFLEIV